MKRIFQCILVVAVLLTMAPAAFADAAWYQCSISAVGYDNGTAYVQLTDLDAAPKFTDKYFQLDSSYLNQQLAIFLTAQSSGSQVSVDVDLASGDNPKILGVYANNP